MGKILCFLCGRNDLSSVNSLIEHVKSQHAGKLSESSVKYLLEIGIKPNKLIEYCKENKIKLDESKVYRTALKLLEEKGEKKC